VQTSGRDSPQKTDQKEIKNTPAAEPLRLRSFGGFCGEFPAPPALNAAPRKYARRVRRMKYVSTGFYWLLQTRPMVAFFLS
jgi:hypothetical protein